MKIIIISPHPSFGGSSTANQNIAKAIACAGHEVVYMDEYLTDEAKEKSGLRIDRYPVHRNKILKQFATYRYLRSLKPDVVIFGVPIIGVFMWLAALLLRMKGVRIGCIFHSLSLAGNFAGKISDFIISCFASTCTHLFFVSDYTLVSWKKFLPLKCKRRSSFVIFNPIEKCAHTKNYDKPAVLSIGFVGRLSREKQPIIFCNVAKEYSNESNVRFVAYGDGPLFEECKEQYSHCVDFKGYCNDIARIYDNIDILLMTSEFENCPMVILEAAARGIPAVVPAVGGIPEIIRPGYNGEMYETFTVEQIKEKLDIIMLDYTSYSRNSYEHSKQFTIEEIAKEWNRILDR